MGVAGGINALLPGILKCHSGPLLDYILVLFQDHLEGEACTLKMERCSGHSCAKERSMIFGEASAPWM